MSAPPKAGGGDDYGSAASLAEKGSPLRPFWPAGLSRIAFAVMVACWGVAMLLIATTWIVAYRDESVWSYMQSWYAARAEGRPHGNKGPWKPWWFSRITCDWAMKLGVATFCFAGVASLRREEDPWVRLTLVLGMLMTLVAVGLGHLELAD